MALNKQLSLMFGKEKKTTGFSPPFVCIRVIRRTKNLVAFRRRRKPNIYIRAVASYPNAKMDGGLSTAQFFPQPSTQKRLLLYKGFSKVLLLGIYIFQMVFVFMLFIVLLWTFCMDRTFLTLIGSGAATLKKS